MARGARTARQVFFAVTSGRGFTADEKKSSGINRQRIPKRKGPDLDLFFFLFLILSIDVGYLLSTMIALTVLTKCLITNQVTNQLNFTFSLLTLLTLFLN